MLVCANDTEGYHKLIRLSTLAHVDHGWKGYGRLDYQVLQEEWDDSLTLFVPFYDSFIHRNHFSFATCVPSFGFTKPIILLEENDLPFDRLIRDKATEYSAQNGYPTMEAQTIYYEKPEDFKAWQTFKCTKKIGGKTRSLNMPELEHCGSDTFNFEHWRQRENDVT